MDQKQTTACQLSFTDELSRRKRQQQAKCKHEFIDIPIAYDHKQDEVYRTLACIKCGYSADD
jgi:hypothetical protein